jgi:hypothetical protein
MFVFKTANNYKGSKIWSFLSKVISKSINLFFSINFLLIVSKFYFFEDYAIENEIKVLKNYLYKLI